MLLSAKETIGIVAKNRNAIRKHAIVLFIVFAFCIKIPFRVISIIVYCKYPSWALARITASFVIWGCLYNIMFRLIP